MSELKKFNSKKKWQDDSQWKEKVQKVLKLKQKGFDQTQVQMITQYNPMEVQRIMEDEAIAIKAANENFKNKLPLIKEVIGMGLDAIRERLITLQDPKVREKMLGKISDVVSLTKVISELNSLLRLEQGQSTENISTVNHSYQETRMVLQELKKKDPIFDYPELPDSNHEQ